VFPPSRRLLWVSFSEDNSSRTLRGYVQHSFDRLTMSDYQYFGCRARVGLNGSGMSYIEDLGEW